METIIIIVFIAGYLAITLEHSLKIDKLVPALIMMSISWALISFGVDEFNSWFDSSKHTLLTNFDTLLHNDKMHLVEESLLHHLGKTAEILVFLLGAMTIVEIIAYFNGFSTIKKFIRTKKENKAIMDFLLVSIYSISHN
jgi:Na+/H+ antiporter NhaD/arsenite permease-like protein